MSKATALYITTTQSALIEAYMARMQDMCMFIFVCIFGHKVQNRPITMRYLMTYRTAYITSLPLVTPPPPPPPEKITDAWHFHIDPVLLFFVVSWKVIELVYALIYWWHMILIMVPRWDTLMHQAF